jgi:hypothetical protein
MFYFKNTFIPFHFWNRFVTQAKPCINASIIWKSLVQAFPLFGRWLSWKVGDDKGIRLVVDMWVVGEGGLL